MNILAFDLGQHFGWAANYREEIFSGHVKTKIKNRESEFYRNVGTLINAYVWRCDGNLPDIVVYEDIQFSKTMAAGQCAGMWRGLLLAASQSHGIKTEGVPVGTWKRTLTGHGSASKSDYIQAVNRAYVCNVKIADENEAAALGVLWWAMKKYNEGKTS